MSERLIDRLAARIAEMCVPRMLNKDGSEIINGRENAIKLLLIDFADEIKREAIES